LLPKLGTDDLCADLAFVLLHQADFVLLPCDLFIRPSSSNNSTAPGISNLLDRHRVEGNLVTALFYERAVGGEDAKKDGPAPLLACIANDGALLDLKDLDDFDEDEIVFRTSLLKLCVHSCLLLAFVGTVTDDLY
jgi:hypothetical protein